MSEESPDSYINKYTYCLGRAELYSLLETNKFDGMDRVCVDDVSDEVFWELVRLARIGHKIGQMLRQLPPNLEIGIEHNYPLNRWVLTERTFREEVSRFRGKGFPLKDNILEHFVETVSEYLERKNARNQDSDTQAEIFRDTNSRLR